MLFSNPSTRDLLLEFDRLLRNFVNLFKSMLDDFGGEL